MRGLAFCLLLGCSYNPARVGAGDAAGGDPDTRRDSTVGSEVLPDTGPTLASCDVPTPTGLVACYLFSDDLTGTSFVDGSANHLDATQDEFTRIMRTPTEPAIQVGGQSSAIVGQVGLLDLPTAFSAVAWVRPTNPSSGSTQGLIDHNGQWAMSVSDNALHCWTTVETATSAQIVDDAWQLVACTWNGTTICGIRISPDGSQSQGCSAATPPGPTGNSGISLGSFQNNGSQVEDRFVGAVDDIRIYSRVLTTQDLCVLAEQPSC